MEKSSFFNAIIDQNGTPDRAYLAEDFAKYFSTFIGNGVFPNPANQLQVVAVDNNMQIRIKAGFAWINGYMYQNTDDYILKLDPADGVLNRIDRIALRLDFLERKIKAVIKKGQYGSNSIAPVLQRNADAYEIAIADVYVRAGVISIMQSNITDTRLNSNVCGIVHGVIQQADTTEIFRQFQAWFNEQKNIHEGDFEKWVNEFKIATGKKFTDWVDDLKNSLDPSEDIAAKLQMQISENKLRLADITTKQGDLINLKTTNKTNLVNAVNELFQNANNGKSSIANVVGNPLLATDTFQQQRDKIQTLKNTFASNLSGKGQSSNSTENLKSLIDKVANINTGKRFIAGEIYVSEIYAQCSNGKDYVEKQHFTKQLNCPFEIGLFVIDLHDYFFNNGNTLYLYIKNGFINSEFASHTESGFSKGDGMHIDTRYTTIENATVNLDWYVDYIYKNNMKHSYFNWIAIEK
ncbi:hypothetical protein [Clostridium botulinum]|uniref:hypothetical protein n=1 Tax=Clostridium botulinum TaxID=1491 RepID=UPI001FAC4671|nr:hypothetical protein [Clostridium botulinum]